MKFHKYIEPFGQIARVRDLDYIVSQILKPDEDEAYLLAHESNPETSPSVRYALHGTLEMACETLARQPVGWFTLIDKKTPSTVVAFPGYGQLTVTPSRIRFGQDFGEGFTHTLEVDPRMTLPKHFTGYDVRLPDRVKTFHTPITAQQLLDQFIPHIPDVDLPYVTKAS
ncbi:MAG TPA: hypothetical protein VK158_06695 [Acidobacteriota bacterium]|nr:hypothetical protein [Acidobacteriota bacterium]